jgi:GT2 family glycosyltransferase
VFAVRGTEPRTTVVVVTWRGRHLVGACLDALAAQTAAHAVLVVDNASTDGTAAVLAAHPSAPRVLRLRRNAGYAGGLAAALRHVRTPYVAWLNDDAEPEPSWLAELEAALDADPNAAAASSLLLSAGGAVLSAGVRLTPLGYGCDARGDRASRDHSPDGVFGFCGGAGLLRTGALRAAGGVPARFFCYYEDTDTAWRLRLAGAGVVSVPAARARHRHGASAGPGSRRFHRWNERNRLLMLLRCAPAAVAIWELARFAAITLALPLRSLRPAQRRARPANHRVPLRLLVLAEVAARLPATLAQRATIGRRAALTRRAVWQRWAGR